MLLVVCIGELLWCFLVVLFNARFGGGFCVFWRATCGLCLDVLLVALSASVGLWCFGFVAVPLCCLGLVDLVLWVVVGLYCDVLLEGCA